MQDFVRLEKMFGSFNVEFFVMKWGWLKGHSQICSL